MEKVAKTAIKAKRRALEARKRRNYNIFTSLDQFGNPKSGLEIIHLRMYFEDTRVYEDKPENYPEFQMTLSVKKPDSKLW